jgi:hypothetical protein
MGRGRRRREGEAVFSIGQEAKLQSNPWFPQTRQWSADPAQRGRQSPQTVASAYFFISVFFIGASLGKFWF